MHYEISTHLSFASYISLSHPGTFNNINSPVEAMNKCRDFVDVWNWFAKDCVYWIYNPTTSECYLSKTVPSRKPTPPEGSSDYRIMGGIC